MNRAVLGAVDEMLRKIIRGLPRIETMTQENTEADPDAAQQAAVIPAQDSITDRLAVEDSSWSNGAFTHCLLEGLSEKADGFEGAGPRDGAVTLGELRTYLNSMMPEVTLKALGSAIHPPRHDQHRRSEHLGAEPERQLGHKRSVHEEHEEIRRKKHLSASS
ncbi:hypothetical protein J7M28_12595 [bacterium]|nr:hypothetical protein [bacterium]